MLVSHSKNGQNISKIYFLLIILLLNTPTIIGIIHNRWFYGQYTIQMQVAKSTRLEYPSGTFSIGIYSTNSDIGYSKDNCEVVIHFGLTHVTLSLVCGFINLGICKKCGSCNPYKCSDVILCFSACI